MPGIKLLKQTPEFMNFIINELLKPPLRYSLFDDFIGMDGMQRIFYSKYTYTWGIMAKGRPEPIGVIFVTGAVPYRSCSLYVAIFNEENRNYVGALLLLARHEQLYGDTLDTMVAKARIYDKEGRTNDEAIRGQPAGQQRPRKCRSKEMREQKICKLT